MYYDLTIYDNTKEKDGKIILVIYSQETRKHKKIVHARNVTISLTIASSTPVYPLARRHELIGPGPWLVGPTELPRCPGMINMPGLPTFVRKINNEQRERGSEKGRTRAVGIEVLIRRRRFVSME